MKKTIITIIFMLIFPLIVHAETITYDICNTCEYSSFGQINEELKAMNDIADTDVIINIQSLYVDGSSIGALNHMPKSITINGNEYELNQYTSIYAKKIILNDIKASSEIDIFNSEKIIINNSNLKWLVIFYADEDEDILSKNEINFTEVLEIDEYSLEKIQVFGVGGNISINDMNFNNTILGFLGGDINIYNCNIKKMAGAPMYGNININIYNSNFENLKYKNITSSADDNINDLINLLHNFDLQSVKYDIYDINANIPDFRKMKGSSTTTVYFDKELELKPSDKIKLTEYLDYYTDDKEIDYVIEDESIAKIENKELVGLKEGSTNLTVTTDDGHVVYRIKLNVIRETIIEKKDSKTIEIPITGIKIKLWVLVSVILLFGIIGVCIYILIRSKKAKLK